MQADSDADRLLDHAHDALIAGDLAALGPLAEAMEKVQGWSDLDRPTAERLRRKADRNGQMLQAAARGVRAAQRRLAEISAEPGLTTYDARGRREQVGQVSGAAPRRI
jgi:hypothetical protein